MPAGLTEWVISNVIRKVSTLAVMPPLMSHGRDILIPSMLRLLV